MHTLLIHHPRLQTIRQRRWIDMLKHIQADHASRQFPVHIVLASMLGRLLQLQTGTQKF